MSRKIAKKGQTPALKDNERYIVQDSTTGEYRLMRDYYGVQGSAFPTQYQKPTAKKELITEFPDFIRTSWKWARWGKSDRYPHETIEKLKAVPIAGRAINDLIKLAYGEGIQYMNPQGVAVKRPDIEFFLKQNKPHLILPAAYGAYYRHNAVFAVFTLDANQRISKIEIADTAFCRFAVQDEKTLKIDTLLYSKKFGTEYTAADEDIIALPILDRWDTTAFFEKLKTAKFAMFLHGESPAMMYYPEQPWAGLLKENGWLQVSADVPYLIAAMQRNQVLLKYKIGVDERRFRNMYGDAWRKDDFTFEGKNKKELRDAYWEEIEKAVSGPDNAGKSIKYIFESDPMTGRIMDDIIIEAIDDKVKVGQYIPNSQAADQQIVQALGIDPSMVGLQGMDTALGGNSGANKRVGYNQAVAMNTLDQDIVLEIYNFVAEYNGWDVVFEPKHIMQTTINEQESGIVPPK